MLYVCRWDLKEGRGVGSMGHPLHDLCFVCSSTWFSLWPVCFFYYVGVGCDLLQGFKKVRQGNDGAQWHQDSGVESDTHGWNR